MYISSPNSFHANGVKAQLAFGCRRNQRSQEFQRGDRAVLTDEAHAKYPEVPNVTYIYQGFDRSGFDIWQPANGKGTISMHRSWFQRPPSKK